MNILNLKKFLPSTLHQDVDHLNNELERLLYENKRLSNQATQAEETVNNLNKHIEVLIRQTDEWAKSYDRLLKDFVHYRTKRENKF